MPKTTDNAHMLPAAPAASGIQPVNSQKKRQRIHTQRGRKREREGEDKAEEANDIVCLCVRVCISKIYANANNPKPN